MLAPAGLLFGWSIKSGLKEPEGPLLQDLVCMSCKSLIDNK